MTGHAKYVYVAERLGMHRWECAACDTAGHWVRSINHATEMGERHANKFKGPKALRDLLKLDPKE